MSEERENWGTSVGRDVSAGGDFVGRDKTNVGDGSTGRDRYDIRNEIPRQTDSDIMRDLQYAIRDIGEIKIAIQGDPYNRRGLPGLAQIVDALTDSLAAVDKRQNGDHSRLTTLFLLNWVNSGALIILAFAMIWLVIRFLV